MVKIASFSIFSTTLFAFRRKLTNVERVKGIYSQRLYLQFTGLIRLIGLVRAPSLLFWYLLIQLLSISRFAQVFQERDCTAKLYSFLPGFKLHRPAKVFWKKGTISVGGAPLNPHKPRLESMLVALALCVGHPGIGVTSLQDCPYQHHQSLISIYTAAVKCVLLDNPQRFGSVHVIMNEEPLTAN